MDNCRIVAVVLAGCLLLSLWSCKKDPPIVTQEEEEHSASQVPVYTEDPTPPILRDSNGLEYQWAEDLQGCVLIGRGSCKAEKLQIPSEVEGSKVVAIGVDALADYSELKTITLPDSVTLIGGGAFRGCTNLTEIQLGQFVESIDRYAFQNCSSLKQFTMPHTVISMGMGAFSGCTSLVSIAFSDHIPEISRGAFENCTGLITLFIPKWATYIAPSAFAGCSSLVGLTIPEWVSEIGSNAFSGCTALKKVVFDDPNGWSVTSADLAQPILPELSDSAANVTLLTTDYAEGTWVKES